MAVTASTLIPCGICQLSFDLDCQAFLHSRLLQPLLPTQPVIKRLITSVMR